MATYTAQIATAKRLLAKFGETSTVRRRVDGTPADADKPWEPGTPTYTEYEVSAVWLDYELSLVDGTLIQRGDQRVYVAASDITVDPDPAIDAIIRASGERWTIQTSRPLAPNGEKILYELQVRR